MFTNFVKNFIWEPQCKDTLVCSHIILHCQQSIKMCLNNSRKRHCCVSDKADQLSSNSLCRGVRLTRSSSSAKNCDKVIPNPLQTLSSVCIVGVWFLRYQVDMVDWDNPDRFAKSYSDQLRLVRSLVISSSTFFTLQPPHSTILRLLYFTKNLNISWLSSIIYSLYQSIQLRRRCLEW